MSTSGLCRCSTRAQEVGPVPVFVSEENPGALASSLYCTRGGRQPAYVCLYSRAFAGLPARLLCIDTPQQVCMDMNLQIY